MLTQAKPGLGPLITKTLAAAMSHIDDEVAFQAEIDALCSYMQDLCMSREVLKQRKQWDDERQAKISEAVARSMKDWDNEHYPRLLEATWGWHPFYAALISNPLCINFTPSYPLYNSVVEGLQVHALLLEQSHVVRAYPVPWSVLLLRCFLKFHGVPPPLLSHPHSGGSVNNVQGWLKLADEADGEGSRAWQLARAYLKDEGFLVFAGARLVDSAQEWVASVEAAWIALKNPTPEWWAEFRMWCHSIQYRALQDMAFHDKPEWLNCWVIRDPIKTPSPPIACYERWLRHREDLDIGYVLGKPGNHMCTC